MNGNQFTIRNPEYLETFEAFRDSESLRQIALEIKKQIVKKGQNLKCLDSMAGTGIVGRKMKETFNTIEIISQDKSPKMLTADPYEEEERVKSDAAKTGFIDDTFDIVLCRGGLNNVAKEDYPNILKEYIRIMKVDGVTILQDHFAGTDEEKEVINSIEAEVAVLEGRKDSTYIPTIRELEQLIQKGGGKTDYKQNFQIRLSLKERFAAKGIDKPNLSKIKEILKVEQHIQYKESDDDVIIVYPIFTITFKKKPQNELNESKRTLAIERGEKFLETENQNGFFPSYVTSTRGTASAQQAPREVFSSIIIADTLPKQTPHEKLRRVALQYIAAQTRQGQLSFLEDRSLITPDADTNSLGYSVLLENSLTTPEIANKVLDSILEHRDDHGRIQVWLSQERENRLDHVVGANAVYFARLLGRGDESQATEDWLMSILDSKKYVNGSRYYHSPDSFLYFLGRLTKFPKLERTLKAKLGKHLQQRVGKTEYSLDLAMRTILANFLGIQNDTEKQKLLSMQEQGGSWPADVLYRQGTNKTILYSNQSVPTAFSIRALSN